MSCGTRPLGIPGNGDSPANGPLPGATAGPGAGPGGGADCARVRREDGRDEEEEEEEGVVVEIALLLWCLFWLGVTVTAVLLGTLRVAMETTVFGSFCDCAAWTSFHNSCISAGLIPPANEK